MLVRIEPLHVLTPHRLPSYRGGNHGDTRGLINGLSLEQFQGRVKPVFDVRVEMAENANRVRATQAKRRDVEIAAIDLLQQMVHAIKADPALGENCPLYAALGYVRRNDRYLSRKRTGAGAAPAVPANDVKAEVQSP